MATTVATRAMGAVLQEERLENELDVKTEGSGGLEDILVRHVSRLEAEKAAAKTAREGVGAETKRWLIVLLNAVCDLQNMFVYHVPYLEREKTAAKEAVAKEE